MAVRYSLAIPVKLPMITPSLQAVSVENTTVVPPRSEALVAGKIVDQYTPVLGLLESAAESSSATDLEMADVVLCGLFQGSGKTKDGDSLPSPRVHPKPLPEGEKIQNGSSSSTKAFVVMGATNDLRAGQIADDDFRKIIAWQESCHSRPAWKDISIENKSIKTYWRQWDRLSLLNGVLCRRWESETEDEVRWQFVVPSNLRNDILHELHTMETAGHLSVNKTLERVRERFCWPGCTKDVKD